MGDEADVTVERMSRPDPFDRVPLVNNPAAFGRPGPARVERRTDPSDPSDPFMTLPSQIVPAPQMITAGRYRLPNRDGSAHKGGWTRATNLASAISDTKALGDWEQRMVLLGVREALRDQDIQWTGQRDSPVAALMALDVETLSPGEIRGALMDLAKTFKDLAKAELGATRGNLAHQMVEHHHAGLPQQFGIPPETLEKLPSYITRMTVHKLQALPGMQERQVMVEALNSVGTLDNILRDLCQHAGPDSMSDYIADLKTQKRFWSWLEIACQLALYAHGDAMWNRVTAQWEDMPPVNQERAIVAWMPWEHPAAENGGDPHQVDLYEVDIVKGWDALQTAHEVFNLRAAAKAKSDAWGWMRPAPRVGLVEAYGARLRDVSTRAEASAVYAEATKVGAWGPELQQVAEEILPRLA